MTRFSVGDRVVLLFGDRRGQKGRILKAQSANAYQVKIEDGPIYFFSEKGLEKDGLAGEKKPGL